MVGFFEGAGDYCLLCSVLAGPGVLSASSVTIAGDSWHGRKLIWGHETDHSPPRGAEGVELYFLKRTDDCNEVMSALFGEHGDAD